MGGEYRASARTRIFFSADADVGLTDHIARFLRLRDLQCCILPVACHLLPAG